MNKVLADLTVLFELRKLKDIQLQKLHLNTQNDDE